MTYSRTCGIDQAEEPHSKTRIIAEIGRGWLSDYLYCCGTGFTWHSTWAEAMDAAHAHVREHHTPTWQPCGRGICAAEAGHEGTCEEASGFYDWTPEFYEEDLDAHRDAMSRGQSARITVTYTRDDPDDQEPAALIWADAYRANGARA